MKPLYVKKNGVVYKISGNGMPALYPAENVEYDNTVTSELQATDVQGAIDELSTRQGGVQSDWNENDSTELDYIKNKPVNLVQDASYVHTDNNYDATAKNKVDSLGTASTKDVGVANGVAELDAAGKVPSSQLPSFVDDVIEVADYDHLPITGESGKIYVTLNTNKTYRWTGSGYAEISESLALGETSSTAYRGDRGKTAYDHATETKLSTATASGLYKVAATAQGHISSLTAVQKSDITGLGIPAQDTIIKNTAYGTCDTAGDVKDKVATLVNATNWVLEVGTIVGIRFTYTNTYTNQLNSRITLNINNTGAKTIRYSDDIWTSSFDKVNPTAYGESDQTIYYMYDGTYWVWVSHSKDNDTLYNFKGNEFRSADGNNAGQEIGFGGNANLMVVNGHYYYNSNGPSTDIGASANDGAIYVQAYDEDNVTQIAQNYETGNLFVRSKVNGSWTEWKKTIANITANNTILSTDKTPFLTRQTLNPTGFSGYVREKLIGASYAWNQLCENGDFSNGNTGWNGNRGSWTVSSGVGSFLATGNPAYGTYNNVPRISGHKYLAIADIKLTSASASSNVQFRFYCGTEAFVNLESNTSWQRKAAIVNAPSTASDSNIGIIDTRSSGWDAVQVDNAQVIDLTLAFGSTIADYLYNLANNGGITKLRDMGCPIDKYTPYGYGLYSVKTSGKKITFKNLFDSDWLLAATGWTKDSNGLYSGLNTNLYAKYRIDTTDGFPVKFKPNTQYTFSLDGLTSTLNYYVSITILYADGTISDIVQVRATSLTHYTGTSAANKTIAKIGTSFGAGANVSLKNIQVEEASSATTYEPYSPITYPLGNDELRGKFDLVNGEIVASGDVKESNGEITRNYLSDFDLGSLNWQAFGSSYPNIFYAEITDGILSSNSTGRDTGSCAKYVVVAKDITAIGDKECTFGSRNVFNNRGSIMLKDTAYSDAATLKTSLSGSYATCEKATPTTEQSTPFADPMSLVGATTEEYIDDRDIPCPVGAERQYMGQSEDVIEIPSSPQSDGKRVLISEVSGGKEQVYWDIPKLYYKEYTVQGDGTKTYGNLLAELDPYYDALSEDEKTYSKVMMRATSSGNECLTFVGNYWYSRMGVNASGLWLDQIDFQYNKYFKQVSGGSITDYTNTNAAYNVIALRVLTYTRAES